MGGGGPSGCAGSESHSGPNMARKPNHGHTVQACRRCCVTGGVGRHWHRYWKATLWTVSFPVPRLPPPEKRKDCMKDLHPRWCTPSCSLLQSDYYCSYFSATRQVVIERRLTGAGMCCGVRQHTGSFPSPLVPVGQLRLLEKSPLIAAHLQAQHMFGAAAGSPQKVPDIANGRLWDGGHYKLLWVWVIGKP